MDWFAEYVTDTARLWRVAKQIGIRLAFREWLVEEEDEYAWSNDEVREISESHIRDKLQARGYTAAFPPASRTPADVWGIRALGGRLHIALVQVKATQKEDLPASLSPDEEEDCRRLVAIVAESFRHSERVPAAERQKPLIISIGYAGVRVREYKKQPKPSIDNAYLIGAFHPKDFPAEFRREVQRIHRAF